MDNTWLQLAMAATIGMMIFFLFPRAMHWMKNGPKAGQGDWMAAVIPLLAVVGFVILLVMMV